MDSKIKKEIDYLHKRLDGLFDFTVDLVNELEKITNYIESQAPKQFKKKYFEWVKEINETAEKNKNADKLLTSLEDKLKSDIPDEKLDKLKKILGDIYK